MWGLVVRTLYNVNWMIMDWSNSKMMNGKKNVQFGYCKYAWLIGIDTWRWFMLHDSLVGLLKVYELP